MEGKPPCSLAALQRATAGLVWIICCTSPRYKLPIQIGRRGTRQAQLALHLAIRVYLLTVTVAVAIGAGAGAGAVGALYDLIMMGHFQAVQAGATVGSVLLGTPAA